MSPAVSRIAASSLVLVLCACAAAPPSIEQSGTLPQGGAILVQNIRGDIDAFAPEHGAPQDRYVVAVYDAPAGAVTVERRQLVIRAEARRPGARFLVRGPRGTTMDLSTDTGSIMVADFDGVANVRTGKGNVRMLLPQYGNASVGNLAVNECNLGVLNAIPTSNYPPGCQFILSSAPWDTYLSTQAVVGTQSWAIIISSGSSR